MAAPHAIDRIFSQSYGGSPLARIVSGRAGTQTVSTQLVLEGGGIEVDGQGTAIITESCVLNANRNPGWSKPDVEAELGHLMGRQKIIWLPGIAGQDITDGHTDFYARFARPGVVVAALDTDPATSTSMSATARSSHRNSVTVKRIRPPRRPSRACSRIGRSCR